MKIVQITYTMTRRDINGQDIDERTERVYLTMLDDIAEQARQGVIDIGITLTMQHIAELQGYSFKRVQSVFY